MSHDVTQQQSLADQQRSRELSLQHAAPPLEVPGYTIERFLGAGAYGEVWVAEDRNTGRRVAIKFYAHKRGVDWSLLSREVEKLVFLSADRYVVQLLEVGWEADPPFYVMEYLEHGSLEDFLRAHGPLPVHEAVELFTEICRGLSHAHDKGVLHCDLKPANILLDQDHRPRLADFGQSRLSSEQAPALGTLFYMAPEQADLNAVPDARWDVYALGAILNCLLVGEAPFRRPELSEQLDTAHDLPDRLARYRRAILHAPPPTAHRRVRGVDGGLAEILERCLAVNPQDRYANVREVLNALAARQRARQMRPVLAFGFAFPLVLLCVMSFFGWRGYQRALADTESLAIQRALVNNEFAAKLAAERVAAELERLFNVVADETDRSSLNEYFDEVRNHPLLSSLGKLDVDATTREKNQREFTDDPKRKSLNSYLQRRLKRYRQQPKLASMLVLNAEGTMIAAAYEGEERSISVARNFAYRSYFHGGAADLAKETRVPAVAPIRETHVSAVFQSSTTGKWRVAVARPIWRTPPDKEEEEVAGVFVVTINLGDFEFFKAVKAEGNDRFAALIDGRPGEFTGTILQHPLFDEVLSRGQSLPEHLQTLRVPVQKDGTLATGTYADPFAHDPLGKNYQRPWLAAAAPVRSVDNKASAAANSSGLIVLVQEDYLQVINPVRQLGSRLVREGLLALLVVLLVTSLLWFAVLRIVREPRATIRSAPSPTHARTPVHMDTTLDISVKQRE